MQKQQQSSLPPTVELDNLASKLGIDVEYINDIKNILDGHNQMNFADTSNYNSSNHNSKIFLTNVNDFNTNSGQIDENATYVRNNDHGPFRIRLLMDGNTFFGHGLTIQDAREEAAKNGLLFYQNIPKNNQTRNSNEGIVCDEPQFKTPVSALLELSAQRQIFVNYALVNESGPCHRKKFVFACSAGNLITEGEGATKKQAKHRAAEKMLEKLNTCQSTPVQDTTSAATSSERKETKNKKTPTRKFSENTAFSATNYFHGASSSDSSKTESNDVDNPDNISNKLKLLKLCNNIGLNVVASTFNSSEIYTSIITLYAQLSNVSISSGDDEEETEEDACLKAIKFIELMGLNNLKGSLKGPEDQQSTQETNSDE